MPIQIFDYHDDTDEWPWIKDPSIQTYPPHPLVDSESAWVLAQAVTELAVIRCPALGLMDALADVHVSVSLLRQGRALLPRSSPTPGHHATPLRRGQGHSASLRVHAGRPCRPALTPAPGRGKARE
jgi:hypothetical protein